MVEYMKVRRKQNRIRPSAIRNIPEYKVGRKEREHIQGNYKVEERRYRKIQIKPRTIETRRRMEGAERAYSRSYDKEES